MALAEMEQLKKLLDNAKQTLVVFDSQMSDDAVAAALAVKIFLEKQNKRVDIVSDGFSAPGHLKFLPGIEIIKNALTHLQKLVIKVDISHAKIETLSYDIKDNWLSIHLSPKEGAINKNDLRTAQSEYRYDLIVTVGVKDLEALGGIFLNNTDLFYKTPIINLDIHPGNEHFGQVNTVDITSTSVSETVFCVLEKIGKDFLDENIALCALTGMISKTRSFKSPNVTPATLNLAGRLMDLGADRELIVRSLYRTRPIGTLKLWGAALSNLKSGHIPGLVTTTITRDDYARSGTTGADLKDIVHEIISASPEAKLILILSENPDEQNKITTYLYADKNFDAVAILARYNPTGDKRYAFFETKDKPLKVLEEEVEKEIGEKIPN